MVDPVTLASGAVAGFQLLKKGFGAGRDLHQMGSELNQVLDYISGVEQAKKQNKKSAPLNDYLAYDKAMTMKRDLEDLIHFYKGSRGLAKYKEFVAKAEKQNRDSKYRAMKRRNDIMQIISIIFGVFLFGAGAVGLIFFAQKFAP